MFIIKDYLFAMTIQFCIMSCLFSKILVSYTGGELLSISTFQNMFNNCIHCTSMFNNKSKLNVFQRILKLLHVCKCGVLTLLTSAMSLFFERPQGHSCVEARVCLSATNIKSLISILKTCSGFTPIS